MNQIVGEQKSRYYNSSATEENIEGGLNINEFQSTIVRKLPLILSCTIVMASLSLFRTLAFPSNYVSSFELLPESINIGTKVTSTDDQTRKTREQITSVELDEVQLKILKSPKLISRAIVSLQDKYPEITYQKLNSGLTIEFSRNSKNKQNILLVTYEDSDKQKVSDVIDVLTQTYLEYSAEKRQSGVERGIAFLDRQIPKLTVEVEDLENQIIDLRTRYNFIQPDISLSPITLRSNVLAQQQDKLAGELQQLRLMLRNLERELRTQPTTSPTALELATPRYIELVSRLRELDVEISRKSTVYSDRSLEMQILNEERRKVATLVIESGKIIRQKLQNEIRTLENRQQTTARETANLRSQLKAWSTVSDDYNKLQQKLTSAKNQLNEFTLQKNALSIDAAQGEAPWQLLTPAMEPKNNDVSTANSLLLGSSLGLLLGMAIALLLDKHQNIVYTSAKVEAVTNLPILGNIPHTPKRKQLSLGKQANFDRVKQLPAHGMCLPRGNQSFQTFFSPSVEAFRSFAANLGLLNFNTNPDILNFDSKIQSLTITSAVSGEGKSTVALNLAKAAASMGKRVLIVDADVRSKVRLTESLGLESEIGLKNLLDRDSHSTAIEHIKQSPLDENLYILTSGFNDLSDNFKLGNSSHSLASAKMYLLMEELKAHFDLVVYDFCAVVGFADVSLLAAKTDGVVMVTGLGKVDKELLSQAIDQLKMCNVPILGIAVNKVVDRS